jgi:lysophospholipase L1-like esterase
VTHDLGWRDAPDGPLETMGEGMSARLMVATLVATLMTALGLLPTTASAQDGPPLRVLIAGDSVTQGWRGDTTWRYWFSTARPDLDLVGNKRGTTDWDNWDYRGEDAYARPDFDQDHAAVYGGQLGDANPDPKLHQMPIDALTDAYQPDVLIGFWGINDLGAGRYPSEVAALYSTWISAARREKPDVDVVIMALPQVWIDGVPELNAELDALAARKSTSLSRVVIAKMVDPYTREGDFLDDAHPASSGEVKIARMAEAAMDELEALNAPTSPPTATQTPIPQPSPALPSQPTALPVVPVPATLLPASPRHLRATVRSSRTGPRVTVTWRTAARATEYDVRCGRRSRSTTLLEVVLRSAAASCRVRSTNDAGRSAWRRVDVPSV